MNRIWSSSQFLRNTKFAVASAVAVILALTVVPVSHASRNGVEEPTNTFTVGITFKFDGVDQLCSGAMLTPTLLITAAHCAYSTSGSKGTDYQLTAPGIPLDAAINPTIVQPKVIKIFTNPTFTTQDANNNQDLAILQLDKAFPVKSYLKVATKAQILAMDSSTAIAGYGYGRVFETGMSYSIYPRKYDLQWRVIDTSTPYVNTFNIISPSATACKGDSGGPIVATQKDGSKVLVGVISGASLIVDGCGSPAADNMYYLRFTTAFAFMPLISSLYDPVVGKAKITIKCKKGSTIKKVTAVKPICPKGYVKVK